MRVGVVLLPEVDPAQDCRWSRAEELGFAHAWCFDHLAWRSLADSPWYATVPALAAAAMTTTTIRLGTFVASPNFRHPVPFAKELMTLDVMSKGRLTPAVGAGGPGYDASVLGGAELTPRERHDRYEEFVVLLDALLRRPVTTWMGEHYTAVGARTIPGPVQRPRPPLVLAGNGPRSMRLALRHGDGWATMGTAAHGAEADVWWRGVAEAVRRFEELAAREPSRTRDLPRYLDLPACAGPFDSPEKLHDDIGRAAELGFTDVALPWPRSGEPFKGSATVLERLAERMSDGHIAT